MVVGCAWYDRRSFPGKEVTSGVEHRDMLKERLGAGDLRVAFFVSVFYTFVCTQIEACQSSS
ncbi:hypothetical protein BCL93_102298 [Onishia taeanensis]|uniref:Uncharacterized protein n=1 Tax=Onishia taeanensis TaxID=284577 RepID=A0A328Y4S5_9GAMM|nr:hypothetical protein BCL93_102298 [Halomonas taeanensis]